MFGNFMVAPPLLAPLEAEEDDAVSPLAAGEDGRWEAHVFTAPDGRRFEMAESRAGVAAWIDARGEVYLRSGGTAHAPVRELPAVPTAPAAAPRAAVEGLAGLDGADDAASTIRRVYPTLAPGFVAALVALARRLGADPFDLAELIRHESRFNPAAVNPASGATGLIQFMPKTALSLGTTVQALRTLSAEAQLPWVEKYLRKIGPPYDRHGLILGVFYPAARSWPPDRAFPDAVRRANPGLDTPRAAVARVALRARLWGPGVTSVTVMVPAVGAGACPVSGIDPCVRPRPE